MVLGVYSDDNGVPDANLAVTDTTAIGANEGWQTVQLTSPVDVNEGDTIWLAWVFETNPGTHYRAVYPTARYAPGQRFEDGMPSDFGTSSSAYGMKFSIHAVYTPKAQPIELLGNPYMFTGRRFDLETGLYYYRARYYNPEIGRFLQTDPIGYGDGINWYSYCANNPLNCVDPSGTLQIVTGRYWVLPNDITPDRAMNYLILDEVAGLIVDIGTDAIPGGEYWEYAEKMAEKIGEAIGAQWWRTYIEVFDWNDNNNDGKIDDNEKSGNYWIEVCGIRMSNENSNVWTEGAGYATWGNAADAGGTAVDWARQNGGVIPNDFPGGWLDPTWGDANPYITGEPYNANEDVLNAVRTAVEWVKKWKEIFEEIAEI